MGYFKKQRKVTMEASYINTHSPASLLHIQLFVNTNPKSASQIAGTLGISASACSEEELLKLKLRVIKGKKQGLIGFEHVIGVRWASPGTS